MTTYERMYRGALLACAVATAGAPAAAPAADLPPQCKAVTDAMAKLPKLNYAIAVVLDGRSMGTISKPSEDGVAELRKQAKNAKTFTCDAVGENVVDGEKALVYLVNSQSDKNTIEMTFLISAASGLPLLNQSLVLSNGAKHVVQQHFLYKR
jgi:hypothetical protein